MIDVLVPKLFSAFREGYDVRRLKADAIAGLTVAIVALPLSMAIAIASGVGPDRGLYTAIVGGFLVSLFGGSRYQIGGPAGAFIVLVSATVTRHGIDGLILAVFISGFLLIAAGYLRLGKYIKFIPYPVTVGFTAGIAVIIFASQLAELFGLTLSGKEPGPLVEKIEALAAASGTFNLPAFGVALITILIIALIKRYRPNWPSLLIAVCVASLFATVLSLPVATIGSRFGGIPSNLPYPALPVFSAEKLIAILPDAVAFTLLGAIESLLSAVVADGMTGNRHRSSMELVGQGIANIGSAIFGGICVTGTIARTATNVRAGGTSPVAGMLHAVFLLLFMLVAAPLASYIPLAALAGVLTIVAWNMIERPAIASLLKGSRGEAVVLVVTFLFVIFRDLTEGIIVGFALGAVLFIDRMGKTIRVDVEDDEATEADSAPLDNSDHDTVIYRITGAFFFGAAATVGSVLDRIAAHYRNFILDCSGISLMDSTGANVIEGLVHKAEKSGITVFIAGTTPEQRKLLETHDIHEPHVIFTDDIETARTLARANRSKAPAT
ncbi:SulP family inorganic anion transporter [Rhizobiaceae bacterium BDR2-2]|uniref:SulP family inorganic anion transporter n=1 Tax=Ectorhizobium quercum TaxID=2965071 RepID=A0AAE3SWW4_9HYPH|nr:SulP family inorganic anion transporter [Ectorhizobium quercum]MCX8997840.1 SulP family inorganic anion transporter [Ectorhizobium quercum]